MNPKLVPPPPVIYFSSKGTLAPQTVPPSGIHVFEPLSQSMEAVSHSNRYTTGDGLHLW